MHVCMNALLHRCIACFRLGTDLCVCMCDSMYVFIAHVLLLHPCAHVASMNVKTIMGFFKLRMYV